MSGPLRPFGPDIWTADGPVASFHGFAYPTRMAVIRLSGGGLFVWSPVALSDALRGIVTRNSGRERTSRVDWADAAGLLRPPPVPARGHPARGVAVPALHAQLPGCRGPAGRARARGVLRDGPALGAEVRTGLCQAAPAAPAEAQPTVAPGRDGGAHRRRADVPVAGGGRRRRGAGRPGAAPAGQARRPQADAQAAPEAGLRAHRGHHRQAALLRRRLRRTRPHGSASRRAPSRARARTNAPRFRTSRC